MFQSLSFYGFVLFSVFFLFSCDKETTEVTSGAVQTYNSIFSKSCSEGSINIKVEAVASKTSLNLVSVNPEKLNVGDEVHISGTVKKSLCGNAGHVSFSCKGRVQIGDNRSFVCSSGTVNILGAAHVLGATNVSGKKFSSGDFHIFGNGMKFFGRIFLSDHSNLAPPCPLSFLCS